MAKPTIRTPEKIDAFLEALSTTASVTAACQMSRITRSVIYDWRAADSQFASDWDKALELGTDALEDEAIRRARQGTLKPVFYKGVKCGVIREFSDTLLIFMLKARRPEKFRESLSIPTGIDGKIIVMGGLPEPEPNAG